MHKGVNTTLDEGQTLVAHSLKADGFDASEDDTGRGTPIVPVVAGTMKAMRESGGFSNSVDHAAAGYMVPVGVTIHGTDKTARVATLTDVAGSLRARAPGGQENSSTTAVMTAIAFDTKGSQVQTDESGATPTLRSMAHDGSHQNGGGQLGVAFAQNQRNELREMSVAGALPAEPGMKQQTYLAVSELVDALHATDEAVQKFLAPTMAVRRLTPLECTRLQGFPDGYFDIPGKPFADGPIYKMLGNSMAVNVMRWIGERIQSVKEIAA
jgi:DNA (cytosine-5)-methyltransferase 1